MPRLGRLGFLKPGRSCARFRHCDDGPAFWSVLQPCRPRALLSLRAHTDGAYPIEASRCLRVEASYASGRFAPWRLLKRLVNTQLLSMDILALATMKNAAKCDT